MNPTETTDSVASGRMADSDRLLSRVRAIWVRTSAPDALDLLGEHASLRGNRALAIDLAYEEYCMRRENGETIDVADFCNRFPSIQRSLHKQLVIHEELMQHPSLVGRQVLANWPRRGDELFGFVVVEEIGRGAFARAYLCAQPDIGNRQVVVKVAPGGALEADTMGGLDHPNIMAVYSVQEDPDSKLSGICMPFVGRSTLYDVIDVAHAEGRPPGRAAVILEASRALARRGDRYHQLTPRMPLRPRSSFLTGALKLALQIAEALDHAHERGVLHGDLKPSNVVMSVNGVPLLVDFNLSHSRESNNLATGGTLPYMAPEQIQSALLQMSDVYRIDQRSDLFSLGVMLFELLTGQLPFEATSGECNPDAAAGRMLDAQESGMASLPRALEGFDPSLSDLIIRCLAFDPAQRPSSAAQVADELRRQLSWLRRLGRHLRRHRALPIGLTAAAVTGMLAATLWWSQLPPPPQRHYERALSAYRQSDYTSALESLNLAIAADQGFADAYLARGCAAVQCYERDKFRGWLESALRDFTQAARLGSGPAAQEAAAYCLICTDDFLRATSVLERLHEEGSATAGTANNLGYCYEKLLGRALLDRNAMADLIDQATASLQLAISMEPDLIQAHFNLAIIELQRYRLTDHRHIPIAGLEAARKAIALGSHSTSTYFFAARLAGAVGIQLGEPEYLTECLEYLEQAVERGHDLHANSNSGDEIYEKLRDRPRFEALLQTRSTAPITTPPRLVVPSIISSPSSLAN